MLASSFKLDRVKEAIRLFSLLEKGEEVIVALSGGADSVFCLLALRELGYGVRAVHINHGIRHTADRDEKFVRDLCEGMGVKLKVFRVKIEGKSSLEERARNVRYSLLKEAARREGIGKVCLAHNLTDAYETALFNLSRGTGSFGLVLPPKSGIFIRPLILLWRDEIREAMREANMKWVEDESNYDLRFSRNFIRLRVLPQILELFPDLPERFRNTYITLNTERDFLKGALDDYLKEETLTFAGLTFLRRSDDYLTVRALAKILNVGLAKAGRALERSPGRIYEVSKRKVIPYRRYIVLYSEIPRLEERRKNFTWEHLNMKLKGDTKGIVVRPKKPGERWIKEMYDRRGIPRVLRSVHPVVEKEGEVVWIPGMYGSPGSLRFVKICSKRPYLFDVYGFLGIHVYQ